MKRIKWDCDGVEIQEIGEVVSRDVNAFNEISVLHIVKFKNLKINGDSKKKQIVIKGDSFLSTLHYFYHHSVIDMLGVYFLIKSYVPDLKCYFNSMYGKYPMWRKNFDDRSVESYLDYLKSNPFGRKDDSSDINFHEYTKDLVNIFSEDKNIYTTEVDNIMFENFYIISELPTGFAETAYTSTRNIKGLSTFVSSICTETQSNKIFISRKLNNQRYSKEISAFPTEDPQSNQMIRRFDQEHLIEDYFNSIGYKSVTLEGMPMLEQFNLFHNATHVAGLNGSGFVNLIAAKDKTNIIELNLIKDYVNRFSYKRLFEFKDFNYIEYNNVSNDIDSIINELKLIKDID